jgi:hypothetical protein
MPAMRLTIVEQDTTDSPHEHVKLLVEDREVAINKGSASKIWVTR